MSSEKSKIRGADGVRITGRQHCDVRNVACASQALRSRRPHACMETSRARTERPCGHSQPERGGSVGEAMSYKSHVYGDRESHNGIVPTKRSNAGQGGPKEIVEGRPLTKENTEEPNPYWTPSRESGPSGLDRVREAAKSSELIRQALFSDNFWKPATDFHSTPVDVPRTPASKEPRRRRDCI